MATTSQPGLGPNWTGPIIALVLGAVLFGSGYWLGQRSFLESKPAQAAASRPPWNPGIPAHPLPTANIPANATPELKEFLENRAKLNAKMDELRGQGTTGVINPQAYAQFQKDNADLLKRQADLGKIIAQQQAGHPQMPPPPLQVPANASPQLKAFLTARDQLTRDQIAFENQHRTDDPDARKAAMQQWRKDNAARLAELQQLSRALQSSAANKTLAPSSASTPTATPAPAKK